MITNKFLNERTGGSVVTDNSSEYDAGSGIR